jgi:hypothetical protein
MMNCNAPENQTTRRNHRVRHCSRRTLALRHAANVHGYGNASEGLVVQNLNPATRIDY